MLSIGTLILIVIGLLVSYYCLRNQFMVSQSLVFINFSIFASWWIIYLLYPKYGIEAIIDLGFHIFVKKRVRLHGIDTPEIRTRERGAYGR